MIDEHLLDLRNKILEQQHMVDVLLRLLSGTSDLLCVAPHEYDEIMHVKSSPPTTYADVRSAFEQRSKNRVHARDMRHLVVPHEKEPPASLFLKLSQLMLKWSECELAVLKELRRDTSNVTDSDSIAPLNEEEWELMQHYFADTSKNRTS